MDKYTGHHHYLNQVMHVVVTGVASGIGRAQAKAFLRKGHHVTGLDIQSPERIEDLASFDPIRFTYIQLDVSDSEAIESKLMPYLARHFLGVDVLCNTAGQLDGFHKTEDIQLADWMHILQTNLTSQFIVTKACLPYLLQKDAARIINMASIAGLTAGGGSAAYTASKHGVVGLTKQLAYDYADTGLRVNGIAPGAVKTAMTQEDFKGDPPLAEWVQQETPTKRWATPDDIAGLTLFLASDASEYMTGTIVPVDGGWLIR